MKGPWRVLEVQGSPQIFHFLWPDPNENNYWLYGIKGLWGDKGRPSLGPGPALVLQWTPPWPYNTPNMTLYILAIFFHSTQQNPDHVTLETQRLTSNGPVI